ncbi:MAG: hypothetical protein FWE18_03260 [Alphaproteobacteria bacterium]|nr:hypothetical protein [Alphaproteobacteria bacterium]
MKKLVFCHGLGFTKSLMMPLILSIESFYGSDRIHNSHFSAALQNSLSLADLQRKDDAENNQQTLNSDSKAAKPKNKSAAKQGKTSSSKVNSTEDSFIFNDSLDNQIEIINLDMGYFGDKITASKNLDGAVAIGHGLGFNKLLAMNVKWCGIVGISTLLQFVYDEESRRKIENLESSLNINSELALKSLIARLSNGEVAINLPYPNADINLIKADAEYLKNTDSRQALQKNPLPTLFLHGGKDNWFNAAAAEQQFKDYNILINADASHILGFLQAAWCRDNIIKFIDSLS